MKISVFNKIAENGLKLLSDYELDSKNKSKKIEADAVVLRSEQLGAYQVTESLLAVARAGAGTNNIPVADYTERGIVVFNTPGANANAVKELVISAMLLSARNIVPAANYAADLSGTDQSLNEQAEANKKQFAGFEIKGRTLCVVGLGAIGVLVANAAISLGLKVVGYDPAVSVENAWQLSPFVKKAESIEQAVEQADFISLHVPLITATEHLVNSELLKSFSRPLTLLNFSRAGIVDPQAVLDGLSSGVLKHYISDFPVEVLQGQTGVLTLPHIGASTAEAEQNCAEMACRQLKNFLESGVIVNSVNFPTILEPKKAETKRIIIFNQNIPNVLAKISKCLGNHQLNIDNLINKSRGDHAVTIVDVSEVSDDLLSKLFVELRALPEILKVRVI